MFNCLFHFYLWKRVGHVVKRVSGRQLFLELQSVASRFVDRTVHRVLSFKAIFRL